MIIRIDNKNYRIKNNTAAAAKRLVKQVFDQVRVHSENNGIPGFYTAFVVVAYMISASILQELGPDKIKEISISENT